MGRNSRQISHNFGKNVYGWSVHGFNAAEQLNNTQPTISRQLAAPEEEPGARFTVRK